MLFTNILIIIVRLKNGVLRYGTRKRMFAFFVVQMEILQPLNVNFSFFWEIEMHTNLLWWGTLHQSTKIIHLKQMYYEEK